ncbi:MAG: hypothetical protein ABIE03_07225 [Patescibacteria group bacterium]|nr:hypothetical protein [Patescibacteria group bacterium]
MKNYKCEVCGTGGARFRSYRKITGMIILSRVENTKPRALCDKHKVSGGMRTITWNLLLGWWGITAFIWNILALIHNLKGGKDVTEAVESEYAKYMGGVKEVMEKQRGIR